MRVHSSSRVRSTRCRYWRETNTWIRRQQLLNSFIVLQKRYIMGEKWRFAKASDNWNQPIKEIDDDAHRLTKAVAGFHQISWRKRLTWCGERLRYWECHTKFDRHLLRLGGTRITADWTTASAKLSGQRFHW